MIINMLFKPTENDRKLIELVKNSYKSLQVVGRGTIKIDPKEVRNTEEFKRARKAAKDIVKHTLDAESKNARKPMPPEDLIDAKHDCIHRNPGKARIAYTVKNKHK